MLGGLHMLGAGDGLKGHYILVDVQHVDQDKLLKGAGLTGGTAGGVAAALSIVDSQPDMALDIGLPLAKKYLKENLGVDAEIKPVKVAPEIRGLSEFWPGLGTGIAVSTVVVGIGWASWKLILKRIFT